MRASSFYGATLWRVGIAAVRLFPPRLCALGCQALAGVYYHLRPGRRGVVIDNLLAPLDGDRRAAARAARELFHQFARKLVDLWRLEGGASPLSLVDEGSGWADVKAAHARGRGAILLTPHLGNWELGGPLLTQRGLPLHVVTQAEPETGLTLLRQRARARRGIQTLVIGNNPFAYLEIAAQLKAGAIVAMLVDRPAPVGVETVPWFGRPFRASTAVAELARASRAALIPVCLPRAGTGYRVYALPEIAYDAAVLDSREARLALTGEVLRVFEPVIRQHANQWYHFIPLWHS